MAEKATALKSVRRIPNWIDGKAAEANSGNTAPVFDSATGRQCAEVQMSTAADTEAAVTAAANAFPAWSATPVMRRARVMFRLKELIERDRRGNRRTDHRGTRQGAARCRRGDTAGP
ncbi:MAG: aldehyde dehydrogenase family protein [Woeseiaceae bacterium]|nr:aldehyde dehydrogenase family protein [Woeseiaceae bacterium]